jgi:hypothetical protein
MVSSLGEEPGCVASAGIENEETGTVVPVRALLWGLGRGEPALQALGDPLGEQVGQLIERGRERQASAHPAPPGSPAVSKKSGSPPQIS